MQPSLSQQLSQGMMGNSPMNIQSPSAPTYQPGLTMPTPPPMPNQSIASQFTPSQMQQQPPQGMPQAGDQPMATLPIQDQDQQTPGTQVPQSEYELIIKALMKRGDTLNKIHTMAAQSAFPQPQQPAQA